MIYIEFSLNSGHYCQTGNIQILETQQIFFYIHHLSHQTQNKIDRPKAAYNQQACTRGSGGMLL